MTINFPKADGEVLYGDEVNDIPQRISNLESINQNTILSQNASVTDKTYTYANTDTMSDSTGYNNTVDTINTTSNYNYLGKKAYSSKKIGTVETDNKAPTTGGITTSIVINGNIINAGYISLIGIRTNTSELITINIKKGTTIIATKNIMYNGLIAISFIPSDYSEIFADGDSFTIQISAPGNNLEYSSTTQSYSGTNFSYGLQTVQGFSGLLYSVIGYTPVTTENTIVQTNSKTFNSNVKSILVNANKILNGASTITLDISTDGGIVFEKTAQPLDTIIALDGDNTDVVVKFNLNVDTGNTPELYGYSYQIWT